MRSDADTRMAQIEPEGAFVTHTSRVLIAARKKKRP
jgi:hypothetical protein